MPHIHGAVTAVSDAEFKELVSLSQAQAELLAQTAGLAITLSNAMEAVAGFIPCVHAFSELFVGLKLSFGDAEIKDVQMALDGVRARAEHVSAHRGVDKGEPFDLIAAMKAYTATAAKLSQLVANLHVLASLAERAQRLGSTDDTLNKAIAVSLALAAKSSVSDSELAQAADNIAQLIPLALELA